MLQFLSRVVGLLSLFASLSLCAAAPKITSFTPTSGTAGTSVTLTGTSFTGATAVKFNGKTAASYTVTSSTKITAVAPTGVTTGKLSVTTSGGTTTSTSSFTVLSAPTITSFAPTSGGGGTSVVLTGAGFTGATAVKFNGAAASSYTVTSSTKITAVAPTGVTSGTISVTTPAGTATSPSSFVAVPAPTITGIAPISGIVGTSVVLSGNNFTGATTVKFNGTAATSYAVTSPTQITVTVPTGATTGAISVATLGGTGTSSTMFTVVTAPTVGGFYADQAIFPSSVGTTLRGDFSGGTGSVQPGIGPVTTGFAIPISPNFKTAYNLTVTNAFGIESNAYTTVTPISSKGIFTATGLMGNPRLKHKVIRLLDKQLLVVGGISSSLFLTVPVPQGELYNAATGTFTAIAAPSWVGQSSTLLLDGKVLFIGGRDGGTLNGAAQIWDPTTSAVTNSSYGWEAMDQSATLLADGRVLVAGGSRLNHSTWTMDSSNLAALFDPETMTTTAVASMSRISGENNGVLLPDGRVLVASWSGVEIFDPTTNNFSVVQNLVSSPRPILLPDGRVLVGDSLYDPSNGAITPLAFPLPSEGVRQLMVDGTILITDYQDDVMGPWNSPYPTVFDPLLNGMLVTSKTVANRRAAAIGILPDGRALLTGGYEHWYNSASYRYFDSSEIFDPQSALQIQPNGGFAMAGEAIAFTLTGSASGQPVSWSCTGGTIDSSGLWVAPIKPGIHWVQATNQSDSTIYAVAQYHVRPVKVGFSPSTVTVPKYGQVTLRVTVYGASDPSLTWSLVEGSIAGSITQTGVYTAGATPGVYHVLATSVADPTQFATCTIKVPSKLPPVITEFTVDKASVIAGTPITFSWNVVSDGVDPVMIDITPVSGYLTGTTWTYVSAKISNAPVDTISYALRAQNSFGTVTKWVTVKVADPQAIQLTPSASQLLLGDSQQFLATYWGNGQPVPNVAWSLGPGNPGSVSTSGMFTSPSVGLNMLQAQNLDTPNLQPTIAFVNVMERTLPVITYFYLNGTLPLKPGSTADLRWSTKSATSLILMSSTGDQWDLNQSSNSGAGSKSITPVKNVTYTLQATNALGVATVSLDIPIAIGISIVSPQTSPTAGGKLQLNVVTNGVTGVIWSVLEANGGSISPTGLYTAPLQPGTYTVVATAASDPSLKDQLLLFVRAGVPITVSGSSALPNSSITVAMGSNTTFASSYYAGVIWSVLEPGGGTITNPDGVALGGVYTAPQTPGTYTVVATSYIDSNVFGEFKIIVVPPITITPSTLRMPTGSSQTFGFTLLAPTNRVAWSASGGSITSDGVFTAPSIPGTYNVTVTSVDDPTHSASAQVTVYQEVIVIPVSVQVSPSAISLFTESTSIFGSTVSASEGSSLAVTWSATGGSIVSLGENQGYYTAPEQPGTYTVTATSVADPTKSASIVVSVSAVDVVIHISPSTVELGPGESYKFGSSIQVTGSTDSSLLWRSEAGSVTPYSDGSALYKAPSEAGIYKVTAISNANPKVFATATVTVKAGKPFISVTPSEVRVSMGSTQLFSALGSSLSGAIQWSVLETGGGTIGSDGTYTAPNTQGTFTVVAEGTSLAGAAVYGSAKVSVGSLVIQSPAQILLFPGDTFAFTASQINGATGPLTWSIDEGASGGTVTSEGTYTAPLQAGIFHVRVSNAGGESAVQEVMVTLIDALVISPKVEILEEGDYLVSVSLQASNSRRTTKKISLHFTVGMQEPDLTFKADTLKTDLGVDGPYQVIDVRIEKSMPDGIAPADTPKDLGATAAYRLNRLQRPWISIGGDVATQALDLNSNGLADQLQVGFVADLVSMGSYRWSAALVDVDGLVIARAYGGPASLAAGPNTLQLTFAGTSINAHGKDGPYYLKNVMVQGPVIDGSGDWSGAITGFTANQFEAPVATPMAVPNPAMIAIPLKPRNAVPKKATKKGGKS